MNQHSAFKGPTITGKPGSHASKLAREAFYKRSMASVAVISFTTIVALLLFTAPKKPFYVVAMLCSALGILSAAKFYKDWDVDYHKAKIGAKAEREVAGILAKTNVAELANGMLLGTGGDADHIVLGPGAAVIETKAGNGKVSYEGGVFKVGRKTLHRNAVTQAKNQARALGELTGVWVTAIVCVPGMTNETFIADGVTICGAYELPKAIRSLPPVIDSFAARAFIASRTAPGTVTYTKPVGVRPTKRSSKPSQRVKTWKNFGK